MGHQIRIIEITLTYSIFTLARDLCNRDCEVAKQTHTSSLNAADVPAKWLQQAQAVPGLHCHQVYLWTSVYLEVSTGLLSGSLVLGSWAMLPFSPTGFIKSEL